MANKKKTNSARVAKNCKAGNGGRRKMHVPVMTKEERRDKRGNSYFVEVESRSNMRHGQGSNKPARYTGTPTTFFK